MKPTVGRIVHYHPTEEVLGRMRGPLAAVITGVADGTDQVYLTIFPVMNHPWCALANFSETPRPGHWNWPPREG